MGKELSVWLAGSGSQRLVPLQWPVSAVRQSMLYGNEFVGATKYHFLINRVWP